MQRNLPGEPLRAGAPQAEHPLLARVCVCAQRLAWVGWLIAGIPRLAHQTSQLEGSAVGETGGGGGGGAGRGRVWWI